MQPSPVNRIFEHLKYEKSHDALVQTFVSLQHFSSSLEMKYRVSLSLSSHLSLFLSCCHPYFAGRTTTSGFLIEFLQRSYSYVSCKIPNPKNFAKYLQKNPTKNVFVRIFQNSRTTFFYCSC